MTLTFSKDEWAKVQAVLGDRPAEKFMQYVDTEYARIEAEKKKGARKCGTKTRQSVKS
jgi:hypothetical protein